MRQSRSCCFRSSFTSCQDPIDTHPADAGLGDGRRRKARAVVDAGKSIVNSSGVEGAEGALA
jgi:hypothetical protein